MLNGIPFFIILAVTHGSCVLNTITKNRDARLVRPYYINVAFIMPLFWIDRPYKIHRAPCESGAEGGQHHLVALAELMLVFVKADWN